MLIVINFILDCKSLENIVGYLPFLKFKNHLSTCAQKVMQNSLFIIIKYENNMRKLFLQTVPSTYKIPSLQEKVKNP